MIRSVRPADAAAIANIYNEYVNHSTATFETVPVTQADMQQRIVHIAAACPCLVYEAEGEVVGYCYAHPWKEREAYRYTWETTVYISCPHTGKGIGTLLMQHLIAECRKRECRALIACITAENENSRKLHERMGFRQVSLFARVGYKFGRWLDVTDYELLLPLP